MANSSVNGCLMCHWTETLSVGMENRILITLKSAKCVRLLYAKVETSVGNTIEA